MNWNLSWEKFCSAFLIHREVSAQETVYPFRSQNVVNLHTSRNKTRTFVNSDPVSGRHGGDIISPTHPQKWSVGTWMCTYRLELWCSFHLPFQKKQQCPDCVRHVINVSAGGTEAVRWSVKRQKERPPQRACAGWMGCVDLGRNTHALGRVAGKRRSGAEAEFVTERVKDYCHCQWNDWADLLCLILTLKKRGNCWFEILAN